MDLYLESNLSRVSKLRNPLPSYSPAQQVGLSVVILNLNKPELIVPQLHRLVEELKCFESHSKKLEILIGDTGSTHSEVLEAYESYEKSGKIRVLRDLKYHFSKNNNQVVREVSTCDTLLFLNNDVIFEGREGEVWNFYHSFKQSQVAIGGAYMWFPDDGLQHGGIRYVPSGPQKGMPFHVHGGELIPYSFLPDHTDIPAVTGACLMMDRTWWLRVGGFHEHYRAECQDVDLCLSVERLGGRVKLFKPGRWLHLENATRPKGEASKEDRALWRRRWSAWVEERHLSGWSPE